MHTASQSSLAQDVNGILARANAFFYGTPERTRLTMVLVFSLMVFGITLMQHGASNNACYL